MSEHIKNNKQTMEVAEGPKELTDQQLDQVSGGMTIVQVNLHDGDSKL